MIRAVQEGGISASLSGSQMAGAHVEQASLKYYCRALPEVKLLQVALELPNSTEGAPALRFNGTYEQAGDGCDCIATFDGEQWHLELLSGQCRNIR